MTGMLAVELFETTDERLLVNELAMRPHNSGHWTQDGAVTSQFEQHLRAVLDLPLGDPAPSAAWSVMVNILGGPAEDGLDARFAAAMAAHPAREDPHLRQGAAPRPQGRAHQRRRGATSTTSRTRRGPRHPTSPTDARDRMPRPRCCGYLPAAPPSLVG